jgi:hypothetical protein
MGDDDNMDNQIDQTGLKESDIQTDDMLIATWVCGNRIVLTLGFGQTLTPISFAR